MSEDVTLINVDTLETSHACPYRLKELGVPDGYIRGDDPKDVLDYHREQELEWRREDERRQQEERDKQEYERLKAKYEDKTQ